MRGRSVELKAIEVEIEGYKDSELIIPDLPFDIPYEKS